MVFIISLAERVVKKEGGGGREVLGDIETMEIPSACSVACRDRY